MGLFEIGRTDDHGIDKYGRNESDDCNCLSFEQLSNLPRNFLSCLRAQSCSRAPTILLSILYLIFLISPSSCLPPSSTDLHIRRTSTLLQQEAKRTNEYIFFPSSYVPDSTHNVVIFVIPEKSLVSTPPWVSLRPKVLVRVLRTLLNRRKMSLMLPVFVPLNPGVGGG